jgi:mRNA-degrading endonuclease toxin of MazEF toxin-antitoxin module
VVVSLNERNEKLDTVVVVPFSSLGRQSPTVIQFEPGESGLPQTSFLKAHLISTINKRQFRRIHPRRLSGARMKQLVRSIVCAIDPDALSYQL